MRKIGHGDIFISLKKLTLSIIIILWSVISFAEVKNGDDNAGSAPGSRNDINQLAQMDLSQLLSLKINVASNNVKSIREQPSVVSVILAESIQKSGARNLLDVLKMVPGFWLGVDAQGAFSISSRGVWGIDGKILLLIDGIEQNDLAFSTIVLNNRYSAESIKQIEIIRGPGSVGYGGAAELAVIKVTTFGADFDGNKFAFSSDITHDNSHMNNLTIVAGGALSNQLSYGFSAFIGTGDYASDDFIGVAGNSFSLKNNSNVEPFNINLGLRYGNFEFRIFYDHYQYEDRIGIGGIGLFSNDFFNPANDFTEFTENGVVSFKSLTTKLDHQWLSSELRVDSNLTYSKQEPWYSFYPERGPHSNDEVVERIKGEVKLVYNTGDASNLLLGLSHYWEEMTLRDSYFLDPTTFFNGSNNRQVYDSALYAQYEKNFPLVNVTLGVRYEDHEMAGNKFVPRVAFTKVGDDFHAKLVFNKAFKIPQFGTVATAELVGNPIARSEDATTVEIEYGEQFGNNHYIQGNVYKTEIENYIAYEPAIFANITAGKVGVTGSEIIYQAKSIEDELSASYSFFKLTSTPLNGFLIEGQEDKVLGIPNQMLKFSWTRELAELSSINLTASIVGERYACVHEPSNLTCDEPQKLSTKSDISVYYQKHFSQLTLGIGIANLLDESIFYSQPYRGGLAPIAGLGRRLMIDFEYRY